MYVCVYIYTYIYITTGSSEDACKRLCRTHYIYISYTQVCIYIYIYIYVCIYTHKYIYITTGSSEDACKRLCRTHSCLMYAYTYIHIYIYHTHKYVCIYIYIYTHTQTHIHDNRVFQGRLQALVQNSLENLPSQSAVAMAQQAARAIGCKTIRYSK